MYFFKTFRLISQYSKHEIDYNRLNLKKIEHWKICSNLIKFGFNITVRKSIRLQKKKKKNRPIFNQYKKPKLPWQKLFPFTVFAWWKIINVFIFFKLHTFEFWMFSISIKKLGLDSKSSIKNILNFHYR